MKVIMLNGSPHAKGCTYTALREVADVLEQEGVEVEFVHIGTKPIQGCVACGGCEERDGCVFDDLCNALADKAAQADGIVIGSPVYYGSANGALCALLDRLFYSSKDKLLGKPAAAVVSCRRGGASAAYDRLNKYFGLSNMPIVTSQYWNSVHGFTPDEVRRDLEGLQIMRALGRNMAWMLRAIHAGERKIAPGAGEERIYTNYIR